MKRETVEKIIGAMKETDRAVDQLATFIREIEDEVERKRMLRFIGGLIVDLYTQITRPVLKDYPELHPDFPNGDFRWPDQSAKA